MSTTDWYSNRYSN